MSRGTNENYVFSFAGLGFLLLSVRRLQCRFGACRVLKSPKSTPVPWVSVRADIHMAMERTLRIEGGAPKLMNGTFRYSESIGAPLVRYDVTGAHGELVVESPKNSHPGNKGRKAPGISR